MEPNGNWGWLLSWLSSHADALRSALFAAGPRLILQAMRGDEPWRTIVADVCLAGFIAFVATPGVAAILRWKGIDVGASGLFAIGLGLVGPRTLRSVIISNYLEGPWETIKSVGKAIKDWFDKRKEKRNGK